MLGRNRAKVAVFNENIHTVAMAVLDALHVRHTLLPLEPKELPGSSWREARTGDLRWARTYLFR